MSGSAGRRERPSREEIEAAGGRGVPDVIAKGLKILFCGINPGLYSGAVGHHFARPGNRFWKAVHESGLAPRLLEPREETKMLEYGYGITNLVNRATASADEIGDEELRRGRRSLSGKAGWYRPGTVAVLGLTAYRTAFGEREAGIGEQERRIGDSALWVLPSPSGLNAHYQLADFARLFSRLKEEAT